MKNGILVSLLVLWLAACGGESNTSVPTLSINTELSAGITGMEEQPVLVNAEISEGDSAILNTNYTGNVLEYSSVHFSFTLAETKRVAMVLSTEVSDLELSLAGSFLGSYSFLETSNDFIVFDAQPNEHYSMKIESYGGTGDFKLKLVEANRFSLGLTNDEYLVSFNSSYTKKCIVNGIVQDDEVSGGLSMLVINWSAGYIYDPSDSERTSFSSVNGNTFTTYENYSELGNGSRIDRSNLLILLTDFTSGEVSGVASRSFETTNGQETAICTYSSVEVGHVVL
jgi:hypothetical protein